MNWPAYPAYTDEGVSWIDKYPASWTPTPLKLLATMQNGDSITSEAIEDSGEYPVYGGNGLRGFTSKYKHQGERVLIGRQGALCGNVHLVSGQYWASEHAIVTTPEPAAITRWLAYALRVMNLGQYSQAAAQPGIAADVIGRLRVPTPPIGEQNGIADFLDSETAKVDALIAKQEQLIATLREDRAATITHAVTKGLDVSVEAKGSGVEWLGEMPRHWLASRLKNVISSTESGTSVNAGDWPAGADDIGVLKTSCVSAGWFNPAANKTVVDQREIDRATCPVKADSLVVNRANTPLLVGSAGYAEVAYENLFLSDKLWQVRFNGTLPRFIYYWTQTQVYRSQIAALCVGASSSMQNLAMTDFRNVAIALPPLDEQAAIVSFLSTRTATIDDLIEKSLRVIEVLREYRAALITDAVTGKIDVRAAVT